MTRIVKQTTTERVEIEYTVHVLQPDGDYAEGMPLDSRWEIHRRVRTYPVTKTGAIRWQQGLSTDEIIGVVPQREVAELTTELVDWMGYAMRNPKMEEVAS